MKNWMKIGLGIVVLGIVAAVLGYVFIYNKPHPDYEKATPEFSKTAEALFNEYTTDRQAAEQTYNGKVVEISGTLSKVENVDSLTVAVFALDEGMFGDEGIRCTMLPEHASKVNSYTGREIRLKGFLAGYNDTDIIMEKCSVVKSN